MILLNVAYAFLASIGRSTLGLLAATGRLTIFAVQSVSQLVRPPYYPLEFGQQLLAGVEVSGRPAAAGVLGHEAPQLGQ